MISPQCIIPVNAGLNVNTFSCYQRLQFQYDVEYSHESAMICLSNWDSEMEETVILFACSDASVSLGKWIGAFSHKIIIGKIY